VLVPTVIGAAPGVRVRVCEDITMAGGGGGVGVDFGGIGWFGVATTLGSKLTCGGCFEGSLSPARGFGGGGLFFGDWLEVCCGGAGGDGWMGIGSMAVAWVGTHAGGGSLAGLFGGF
jgi:hypothetical protein